MHGSSGCGIFAKESNRTNVDLELDQQDHNCGDIQIAKMSSKIECSLNLCDECVNSKSTSNLCGFARGTMCIVCICLNYIYIVACRAIGSSFIDDDGQGHDAQRASLWLWVILKKKNKSTQHKTH